MGKILATSLLLLAIVCATAADYPNWRGPAYNGSGHDLGQPLIADLGKAKKLWTCEQKILNGQGRKHWPRGTYTQPILYDGKLYVPHWRPAAGAFAKARFDKERGNGSALSDEELQLAFAVQADDLLLCVDAKGGKVLWQAVYAEQGLNQTGKPYHQAACAADGNIYFLGCAGMAYCVEAQSGATIWEAPVPGLWDRFEVARKKGIESQQWVGDGILPKKDQGVLTMSNPCLVGSVFVVSNGGGGLIGLDRKDGKPVWGTERSVCGGRTSPLPWIHGGRDYVLAFTGNVLSCVDAGSGRIVWQFDEFAGGGAPALAGDVLVAGGQGHRKAKVQMGVNALRLASDGATRLWRLEAPNWIANHTSVCIWQGHVYAQVSGQESKAQDMICLDLQTGKELSRAKATAGYASLVVGDGRIVYADNGNVTLFDATPAAVTRLPGVIAGPANSITPLLHEGILYARMRSGHLVAWSLQ